MEISDVAMGKIHQSDGLDIGVGGAADVNITYTDVVSEVFFVRFTPLLCLDFWCQWHWGGSGVVVVCAVIVWEVAVVVAVVCQGTLFR
jgi:hypothetical protein